ncbi:MAG: hypothetical protein ACR2PZ_15470 [Pseudomonadales bacterium]
MKKLLFFTLLFATGSIGADVLVVNIWDPLPGKGQATAQNAQTAKAIHEKHGATVTMAYDGMGRMHYATGFKNWKDWTKFQKKTQSSKEWTEFWSQVIADPSADLEDRYLLNVVSPGGVGSVYQVYIWEAERALGELIESAMKAEAIHEKAGVDVSINIDQMNRMHYVMSYANWEDWAKFQDGTPSEEWNNYWAEASKDPAGKLIKVYTAGD